MEGRREGRTFMLHIAGIGMSPWSMPAWCMWEWSMVGELEMGGYWWLRRAGYGDC